MTDNRIENIYPQSPGQRAMFLETLSAPGSGINVIQLVWTLSGAMNVFAFEQAWQRIEAKHPILRTLFVLTKQDKALQVVRSRPALSLFTQDWRVLSEADQRDRLTALSREDAQRGFDLTRVAPIRLYLIQVSGEEMWFVWSIHHMLLDRWSLSIVVQELFACYEAFSKGQRVLLGPSRSYGEYAAWLQSQDAGQGETFWRRELNGWKTPTALDWAVKPEHARALPGTVGLMAVHYITLSAPLTKRIEAMARANRLTLASILQGVWALVLSQYGDSTDVVFGTVVSGRSIPFPGIGTVVGPFLNVLPMRVVVAPGEPVGSWLQTVQDKQMAISQYEYCPLTQVHAWSEIPPGTHLFGSMVDLVNYTVQAFSTELGAGLKNTAHRSVENVGIPISVLAYPGAHLKLEISYNECLLDARAMINALGSVARLLEGIAERPGARVSDLLEREFVNSMAGATVA